MNAPHGGDAVNATATSAPAVSSRAGHPWWRTAVFYEVYVRSFQDSNADGIGDLNGIASRLDYLRDLGIDAIWITPFYPSPQVDFGYDIADHEDVDPMFGTLADFDRLVEAAHRRGIKIIIDIVLNHTSDRHPWFQESRSRTSPLRDWYIWRDGDADRPPNNWESAFGGPAWTYDAASGAWYYHFFYKEQPDLNWRNAAVEQRMLAILDFWLQRGVDGFRLDAVNTLFEDEALRDNPILPQPRLTLTGVYTQDFVYNRRLPEVHDALRRVRAFVEARRPDALLISEAYVDTVEDLVRFYGNGDEMHLPFNFFLAQVSERSPRAFREAVEQVEHACAGRWPSLVFNNHDIARGVDRYAPARNADALSKLLATLLLTLRGTPFLYYGEELGMSTADPVDRSEVRDPVGKVFWPLYKGRDGVRRPMAWTSVTGGGFTTGVPWLPLSPDWSRRNVGTQREAPDSVLSYYRALLAVRRSNAALLHGEYGTLAASADVFAYVRYFGTRRVITVLNMADDERAAPLEGMGGGPLRVLLSSNPARTSPVEGSRLHMAALESLVLEPFGHF